MAVSRLARQSAVATSRTLLISIAWICTLFWATLILRLAYSERFTEAFSPKIKYKYNGAKANLLEYEFPLMLLFMGSAFLAALCVCLALWLPKTSQLAQQPSRFRSLTHRVSHLTRYQLPPRHFWSWWCGGLSLGELIFYLFFLAAIASLLQAYLSSGIRYVSAIDKVLGWTSKDKFNSYLTMFGAEVGFTLMPCFLMLLWPVSQDNFLNHLLGLPYQSMIKYHRWMGHVTCWFLSLHGLSYLIYYGTEHNPLVQETTWWKNLWSWKDSIPHAAGLIAWFGALALQITAIEYIRRRYYNVFYRVHIAGFLVVVLFGAMHYASCFYWFVVPLMPWFVDVAMRFAQGAALSTITACWLSDDHSIVTIELTLDQDVKIQPLMDYKLNVPTIDRWAWHFFTCAGPMPGGPTNKCFFHIKKYGNFTKALYEALERGQPLPVRVQGPIGLTNKTHPWSQYPVVVAVVGGVGISPVLSVLNKLVAERQGHTADPKSKLAPQHVFLVWASRHKSEFRVLHPAILAAAREDWLSVNLFYTGSHITRASSVDLNKVVASPQPVQHADEKSAAIEPKPESACPLSFKWLSPLGFALVRPVQAKAANMGHVMLTIVLAHLGVFCAVVVAATYYTEGELTGATASGGSYGNGKTVYYWINGLLLILASFVGGLGLSAFSTHLWAFWKAFRGQRESGAKDLSATPVESSEADSDEFKKQGITRARSFWSFSQADTTMPRALNGIKLSELQPNSPYLSTLVDGRVGYLEQGLFLDINEHRPDIPSVLNMAAAKAAAISPSSEVGVIAAGPKGMVQATKLVTQAINSSRSKGSAYMCFHQETWEL